MAPRAPVANGRRGYRVLSHLAVAFRGWPRADLLHSGALAFVLFAHLGIRTWAAEADGTVPLRVQRSGATGVARYVTAADGGAIEVTPTPQSRNVAPVDFFVRYGSLFGVTAPDDELNVQDQRIDAFGHTRTTFRQVYKDVPVFGALLRVHADSTNRIIAVNGTFVPDLKLATIPTLSDAEASKIAVRTIIKQSDGGIDLFAVAAKLYVYRLNLARGVPGSNHLVYEVEVRGSGVREFVYVDAHKGYVVDRITGIHEALDRRVYDQGIGEDFLVWSEGDSLPYGDENVDNLIEFSEDVYNLIAGVTDGMFLSWDGAGGIMHNVNQAPWLNCPNASWNGAWTSYCWGVTGDDTVAHEWGHAYTDSTHNLIYQWQPGALNEAYSDIFGEVVDLLNGSGLDSPAQLRLDGECSVFGRQLPPDLEILTPAAIAGTYVSSGAQFNPAPPVSVTAELEVANDGEDAGGKTSTSDACEPLLGFTPGRIALIDRGICSFLTKANHAADAGAVGVIVVNNNGDTTFFMSGCDPTMTIPSVMVGQSDGDILKGALPGVTATISAEARNDPSFRWLAGEDDPGFCGAIRDMWNPYCFSDPGKVSDVPEYWCFMSDSGGVHTNSSIPNHAFALLADGGLFNGRTIAAIGLTKAFHIYWRAQSTYQVPASDFTDHADALEQSCADLINHDLFALSTDTPIGSLSGEMITDADCQAVSEVIAAVELRLPPTQCGFSPMLDPDAPPICSGPGTVRHVFTEDWESGMGSWTVGTRAVVDPATFDTPDWAVVTTLPDGQTGSAAFVADLVIGDCQSDTEAGALYLDSPLIHLPDGTYAPRIALDHWVATEASWDGGNVKISVNGGPMELVPLDSFSFNEYRDALMPPEQNDNPLAGEWAFTGTNGGEVSGSWGQSQINLTGLALPGDDIQFRFEMGLDGCNGLIGWYIDDVQVYFCCDTFGDVACDGALDAGDYATFADCLTGPGETPAPPMPTTPLTCLDSFDSDVDRDIDLSDFAVLQRLYDGP
ncbi:MAG: M4 family metallopeptidase [Planctomycetes bacterium]|nr:M4 family metallopeptidase [Planctomycetota bacterium]